MINTIDFRGIQDLEKREQNIQVLEKKLLAMEQIDCPVSHHFGPGIYIREVNIPRGTFAIGHWQNFDHMNIFLKGRVTIFEADEQREISAPMLFTGGPGRKIGYIHEDMTWLNVYPTSETDIEKLESTFLTKSIGFKEQEDINRKAKSVQFYADRDDFSKMVEETGYISDQRSATFPFGSFSVKVVHSPIDGFGIFATRNFNEGDIIGPMTIDGLNSPIGRFANHSKFPNAKAVKLRNKDLMLMATKDIRGCQGGYDGEEITIDYRQLKSREETCQA